MKKKNNNRVGIPSEDKILYGIVYTVMILLLITILYFRGAGIRLLRLLLRERSS